MKEKIEIYLLMEGKRKPELLEVPLDCTFEDLLSKTSNVDPSCKGEWSVMVEDSEEVQPYKKHIIEAGVKNRGHIHCNRCKKVEVTVSYNGRDIKEKFPPSAKAKRILKWAVQEFSIGSEEATDYVLSLEDGKELDDRDYIGIYVDYPNCHITLLLTPKKAING